MLTTIIVIAVIGGFGYFIFTKYKAMNTKPVTKRKSTGGSRTKTTSNVAKKPYGGHNRSSKAKDAL